MSKIKGSYEITDPGRQFANKKPRIELELDTKDPHNIDIEEVRAMQIIIHEAMTEHQSWLNIEATEGKTENDKKFAKLKPYLKTEFKRLIYDFCADNKWHATKIEKSLHELFKGQIEQDLEAAGIKKEKKEDIEL